jgi:hypothetical protein
MNNNQIYSNFRFFKVLNAEQHCVANLERNFNLDLPDTNLNQIISQMQPLLDAQNLSLVMQNEQIIINTDCDLSALNPITVKTHYCQSDNSGVSSFVGVLFFQYINQLFNQTDVKKILDASTEHDCGMNPFLVFLFVLAGLFGLSCLIKSGMMAYSAYQEWPQRSRQSAVSPTALLDQRVVLPDLFDDEDFSALRSTPSPRQ